MFGLRFVLIAIQHAVLVVCTVINLFVSGILPPCFDMFLFDASSDLQKYEG